MAPSPARPGIPAFPELFFSFVKRVGIPRALGAVAIVLLAVCPAGASASESALPPDSDAVPSDAPAERSYLVTPFENLSESRELYWVGEALSEAIERSLTWAGVPHATREERRQIERELGIHPLSVPAIATRLKEAEELDLNRVIMGSFTADGDGITATFRVLDVANARRGSERTIGPLPLRGLAGLQEALVEAILDSELVIRPASDPPPMSPAGETNPAAYEARSKSLLEEDADKRILLLERAVEADPAYLRARLELALELAQTGETRAALQRLTETRLDGDPPLLFRAEQLAGTLFLEAGEPTAAVDALRRSLRWQDEATTHILLARALIARGDLAVAAAELELASRLDPEDPGIAETRELLAKRGGQSQGAAGPPPASPGR